MYTMKESVAVVKEADAKKGVSPARSDNSIYRVRNEPERQLGSLRGVIGNIRRDGGTPSVESIATHLSGMSMGGRAPVLLALQRTHGNRYVQRVVSGIQAKLVVGQPGDVYEQEADRVAEEVMRMPEPQVQRQAEEEKEEDLIQAKPLAEQITPLVQRQIEEEEKEEEILQTKESSKQSPAVSSNLETNIQSSRTGGTPLPKSTRAFFEPRFGHDFSKVKLHTNTRATELARTEITPLMQRQENLGEEKEEELIQTKIARDVTPEVTPAISSGIQSLQGGGRPLSGAERSFFEPRFGADFSNVRIHSDKRASNAARSVNARAFTFGHNVVFGAGEYSPDALTGRKLLAHELTHVVQQSDGLRRKMTLGEPGDEYEREADEVARNVIQQEQYTNPNPSTHEQVGGEIEDEEDFVQKKYSTASPPGPSRTSPTKRSTTHAPAVRSVNQTESHHSRALGENTPGLPVDGGMEHEEELLLPSIALESLPQMPDTPSRSKYSVRRSPAMLGGVADTEKPGGQSVIPGVSKQRSFVRHAMTPNRIQRAELIFNVVESGLSTVAERDDPDDPEVVSARSIIDVTERAQGSRLEVSSLDEMIDDLEHRVGERDCLRDLVVWNHGGPRGQLVFRPHSGAIEFAEEEESPSRFTTEWVANSENRDRLNTLRQLFCCNRGRMSWMGCAVAGVRALGGAERAPAEIEQCIASGEGTEAECGERYQEHWNVYQNLTQAQQYRPNPSTLQYGIANMQYWANATCALVTGANDLTTYVPGAPIPYRVRHGGQMMAVLPTEPCPCEGDRVGAKTTGLGEVPEYLEGHLERECGSWEYGLIRPALERAEYLVERAVQSLQELVEHQEGPPTESQSWARHALQIAFNIWDPLIWPPAGTSSAAPSSSNQLARIRAQNRQRTRQILDRFTAIQSTLAASLSALSSEQAPRPEGTPTATCRTAQHPRCTGGRTFASADPGGQALSFCPVFFESRQPSSMAASNIRGDDRRALILIHEYSHLAGTTDRGPTYLWYGCPPSMGKRCLLPGNTISTECTTPPDYTTIADAYRCFVQVQSLTSSRPTEPESSEGG